MPLLHLAVWAVRHGALTPIPVGLAVHLIGRAERHEPTPLRRWENRRG